MLVGLSFLQVLQAWDVAELVHQVVPPGHALDHHLIAGPASLRFVHDVVGVTRSNRRHANSGCRQPGWSVGAGVLAYRVCGQCRLIY